LIEVEGRISNGPAFLALPVGPLSRNIVISYPLLVISHSPVRGAHPPSPTAAAKAMALKRLRRDKQLTAHRMSDQNFRTTELQKELNIG
jgi:hypothetical protein